MPETSIIIPVYNRKDELKRALNSIARQDYLDFEIIIIDDYSSESFESILNSYTTIPLRYHRLKSKGNANIARNKGIELAKGNFIAFLDSDDQWKKNHLKESLMFIKQNKLDGCF